MAAGLRDDTSAIRVPSGGDSYVGRNLDELKAAAEIPGLDTTEASLHRNNAQWLRAK